MSSGPPEILQPHMTNDSTNDDSSETSPPHMANDSTNDDSSETRPPHMTNDSTNDDSSETSPPHMTNDSTNDDSSETSPPHMSNDSVDDGSPEIHLPNGRLIFDLITSNDLPTIRSLLTPLTLHDRKTIVYQRIEHKTLLYHACECGFRDIVKYLLDECGADTDDGYCDNRRSVLPTRIAVQRLDVFLLNLLLRRRAALETNNRDISSAYFAFTNRYFSIISILMLYKTGEPILSPSDLSENGYSVLAAAYRFSEFRYNEANMEFLTAASDGNIVRMKTLIAAGLNKSFQNYAEENALCLAILNNQRNAQYFLVNYNFYTFKSYVLALELCGAKFVVFRSERQSGLDCWRKSIQIRREYNISFADKDLLIGLGILGMEFKTEEEVEALRDGNNVELYFQALLVLVRLLTKSSLVTRQAFQIVASVKMLKEDPRETLKIILALYYFPSGLLRSPKICALESMGKIFDYHFSLNLEDKDEYLSRFRTLFQIIGWEELLQFSVDFHRIAHVKLLDFVLFGLGYMDTHNLSQEQKKWIQDEIRKLTVKSSCLYQITPIHRAIEKASSLSVVSFLLKCLDDANCTDAFKSTPLHMISQLPKDHPNLFHMTHLLIEAGGHIDSVDSYGFRPLEALRRKGLIDNSLQLLSLQCLAARVISKFNIPVSEKTYPKILVKFIKLHSS